MIVWAFAGCGPARPQTVPVSGKVTFDGGRVPGPGRLYFTVAEPAEGFPSRPGIAAFSENGQFNVTTFVDGDGLMPGRYRIGIECWKVPPTMEGPPAESYLPVKYQSPLTTGWEITVEPKSPPVYIELDVLTES
jgi:hypothetical protein